MFKSVCGMFLQIVRLFTFENILNIIFVTPHENLDFILMHVVNTKIYEGRTFKSRVYDVHYYILSKLTKNI